MLSGVQSGVLGVTFTFKIALSVVLTVVLIGLAPSQAQAADIQVKSAQISLGDEGYALDAEFSIELGSRLEDVVSRGVALYFIAEFDLSKPRWYWADERVAGRAQTYRLSYHALTRQYRLSGGAFHQNFQSLDEALRVMSRLRNWVVAEKSALKMGESYNAQLRMKLDITQLPKPFQVSAIGNKDWSLSTDIKRWVFTATPPLPIPAPSSSVVEGAK